KLVAAHLKTDHTVFSLSNDDFLKHLTQILEYTDEPFADSSGIAVYILSKETRKHATVALSGDGADELFGGYNKHQALLRSLDPRWPELLATHAGRVLRFFPQSRNGTLSNKIRQMVRFSEGMKLSLPER